MTAGDKERRRRTAPVPTRLGRQVLAWRTARGWTQDELGERALLPQGFISQVETGRRPEPAMADLKALARGLGIPLLDFLVAVDLLDAGEIAGGQEPRVVTILGAMRADPAFLAMLEEVGGDEDEVAADMVMTMRLYLQGVMRERRRRE